MESKNIINVKIVCYKKKEIKYVVYEAYRW